MSEIRYNLLTPDRKLIRIRPVPQSKLGSALDGYSRTFRGDNKYATAAGEHLEGDKLTDACFVVAIVPGKCTPILWRDFRRPR